MTSEWHYNEHMSSAVRAWPKSEMCFMVLTISIKLDEQKSDTTALLYFIQTVKPLATEKGANLWEPPEQQLKKYFDSYTHKRQHTLWSNKATP